jgi:type II secretory pathway pseudopilin PulG
MELNRDQLRAAAVAGVVALVAAVGVGGCGGSDDSDEQAVEERIAEERADAAQKVRQRQKIKQLQRDLRELQESGESAATPSSPSPVPADLGFVTYSSPGGGWQAEVPSGGGWSEGVETQVNPGLHRTTFTGPAGAVLIVDSTPQEAPAFSGDAARSPASHPLFGAAEKLVFRGSSSVTPCETATCVDYLIPAGAGGYAVLAGGPGDFAQLEAIAEAVMVSLRPYDD